VPVVVPTLNSYRNCAAVGDRWLTNGEEIHSKIAVDFVLT
jgi:hypothetical protein